MKKPYEKPVVVYSEKLEARAVVCGKTDAACSAPIAS